MAYLRDVLRHNRNTQITAILYSLNFRMARKYIIFGAPICHINTISEDYFQSKK
jgi:hypothetical protein